MAAVAMHHFSGPSAPFVRSKGTVSGDVFTLALKPIQITIELLRKIFSLFSNQKAPRLFSILKKHVNGTYSSKSLTSSLIEYILKQRSVFSRLLWVSAPIAIIFDILGMTVLLVYETVVSIVWYLLCIAISIGKIISKIADRILLLSDRNVVAISFRAIPHRKVGAILPEVI